MSGPSLQLLSSQVIPGDGKITVPWQLTDATSYTAVAMKFHINDSNDNNQTPGSYNYNNSLKWTEVIVPSYLIKNNSFDIPNLVNGNKYVLYGFMIFRSNTDPTSFINVSSEVIGPIIPTAAPPALILDDGVFLINNRSTGYIGSITSSNAHFNLKIVLNNYYTDGVLDTTKLPDSILVMAKDSSLLTSATKQITIPWSDIDTSNIIIYNSDGNQIDNNGNEILDATPSVGPFPIQSTNYPIRLKPTTINGVTTTNYFFLYTIADLGADLSYEVSVFPIKNNGIGALSNTINAVPTQKAPPPLAPLFVFDYENGNVEITTKIAQRGGESATYYINLYKRTVLSGTGSIASPYVYAYTLITNNISYTFDLSAQFNEQGGMIFGEDGYTFKFNTVITDIANMFDPFDPLNTHFNYGEEYDICFTVKNSFGENEVAKSNFSKFTPYKKVLPPVLSIRPDNTTLYPIRDEQIDLALSNISSNIYGQTIKNYKFYIKEYNDVTGLYAENYTLKSTYDTSADSPGLVYTLIQSNTLAGLVKGTKYKFAVSVSIYNNNYNTTLYPSDPEYIESILSAEIDGASLVYARMFSKPISPALTISFNALYINNNQAQLNWVKPSKSAANTSNLEIIGYKIYRSVNAGTVANVIATDNFELVDTITNSETNTYTNSNRINGTKYTYAVITVTHTDASNTTIDVEGDKQAIGTKQLVTWYMPSEPTITNITSGNHWANILVTDNNNSSTGLSYAGAYNVFAAATDYSVQFDRTDFASTYLTGLPNDIAVGLKASIWYTNPNPEDTSIVGGYIKAFSPLVSGVSIYTVTPTFTVTNTKFKPSNVNISSIESNAATVSWTAPTYVKGADTGAVDYNENLNLQGYKVAIYNSQTDALISTTTTIPTNTTTTNITDLTNGISYYAVVIALWDDGYTSPVEYIERPSAQSTYFIPVTNPNPPTDVNYDSSVFGTSQTVKVMWNAPIFTQAPANNNIAISGYSIYYKQYALNGTTLMSTSSPTPIIGNLTNYTFSDLVNGSKYQFYVQTQIINPNDGVTTLSSNDATNTIKAVPFDSTSSLYAVSGFDISSISGTSIGMSWTPNSSLFGLPFDYKLEKSIDGTSWSPLSTILSTAPTSYTDSDVIVGNLYKYRIHIVMPNPNGGTTLIGNVSHVEDAIPYSNPDAPTGLTPAAGDSSVGLTWTTDTVVNGLPVQGYNLYQVTGASPYTYTKLNTSLVTVGTFSHTSLTNGILYKYAVTTVTQNTNDDSADLTSGQNIESGYLSLASATPYKAPDATVATIDITDATSRTNTINWSAVTNTGGFPIAGYNLYQVVSGTPTKLNTDLLPSASREYSHNDLTNGSPYSYIVRAVVLNTNASNAPIESVDSNTVTKIPFTYANLTEINAFTETNETDIKLNWSFSNNYIASGLSITPSPYFIIRVTNNSQPELSYVIEDVVITDTTKDFHITPGNSYSFKMDSVFRNPNDTTLKVITLGTTAQSKSISTFGFADVHLDLIQTDSTTITFAINKLNDIDLKGGFFLNYHIFVYKLIDNTLTQTLTVNQQSPSNQTISGLIAITQYKLVVQVETGKTNDPSETHKHIGDNTYLLATTSQDKPTITNVYLLGNAVNVQLSSNFDIKYIIVAITRDSSTNTSKQLSYYVAAPSISVSSVIQIPLTNIAVADVKDVAVFTYSDTYGFLDVYTETDV